jgi:hypothetical protein
MSQQQEHRWRSFGKPLAALSRGAPLLSAGNIKQPGRRPSATPAAVPGQPMRPPQGDQDQNRDHGNTEISVFYKANVKSMKAFTSFLKEVHNIEDSIKRVSCTARMS